MIRQLGHDLYTLLVPFEDLTTTVYFVKGSDGWAVIDCATYVEDVDKYILPAMQKICIAPEEVRWLLLTHMHLDHSGGLPRLAECFPHAAVGAADGQAHPGQTVLQDGDVLLGRLKVLRLPGHAKDATAFLDLQTDTLLAGDCLQQRGIGRYRNGIQDPPRYAESVRRLMGMPLHRIVAAHEYDPLGCEAEGEAAVQAYLQLCLDVCAELQA